jgi:DNA-binding MurR/RpiR family transcriptional regulator
MSLPRKLTVERVRKIREDAAKLKRAQLARREGVSPMTILRVIRCEVYKRV